MASSQLTLCKLRTWNGRTSPRRSGPRIHWPLPRSRAGRGAARTVGDGSSSRPQPPRRAQSQRRRSGGCVARRPLPGHGRRPAPVPSSHSRSSSRVFSQPRGARVCSPRCSGVGWPAGVRRHESLMGGRTPSPAPDAPACGERCMPRPRRAPACRATLPVTAPPSPPRRASASPPARRRRPLSRMAAAAARPSWPPPAATLAATAILAVLRQAAPRPASASAAAVGVATGAAAAGATVAACPATLIPCGRPSRRLRVACGAPAGGAAPRLGRPPGAAGGGAAPCGSGVWGTAKNPRAPFPSCAAAASGGRVFPTDAPLPILPPCSSSWRSPLPCRVCTQWQSVRT